MRDAIRELIVETLKELGPASARRVGCREARDGPKVFILYDAGLFRVGEALDQVAKIAARAGKAAYFRGARARSLMGDTDVKSLTGVCCSLDDTSSEGVMKVLLRADVLVAPTLSLRVAARVARMTSDCQGSELLMSALLAGQKVVAADDGFKAAGAPMARGLKEEIAKTLAVLADYGVTFCPTAALADTFESAVRGATPGVPKAEEAKGNGRAGLSLVTAADIDRASLEGCRQVLVARKGIVTPLAADLGKERKVEIVRENT